MLMHEKTCVIPIFNLNFFIFIGILPVLRFDFQKLILEILNFHPCLYEMSRHMRFPTMWYVQQA